MMAPAIVFITMRLLAFEHQPIQTSRLATSVEKSTATFMKVKAHTN